MIDTLLSERLIRMQDAAKIADTHVSTVLRWVLRGVPGPGGARIRLGAIRVGTKWRTSREALQRFVEATTPQFDSAQQPPRSPVARERATLKAKKALKAAGI